MFSQRVTALLLSSLMAASANAEEFEFATPPGDVLFGASEFNMPLPPPMVGMGMAHAMPGVPGMPFNLIMLAEQLELTPEQRDKAGKVLDETTPKVRALMFRMMDARKAGNALKSGTASDKDIRRHADEQGEIVAELTYLGLKSRADLRALLTEEQRKKLDSFTEGRGPFFIQRFGHTGSVDPAHMPRGVAGVRELRI